MLKRRGLLKRKLKWKLKKQKRLRWRFKQKRKLKWSPKNQN